jgi:NADH-quinone oxidoreductase subunit N
MPQSEFMLILPELVLTVGGLLLLMLAAFDGDRSARLGNAVAALVLALAILAVTVAPQGAAFSETLKIDGFAGYAKYLIFGSAIVSLLLAPRFFGERGYRTEYPLLVVFASLGMAIMVSANDLMTLYVGLELNSLSAYVLASFMRSDQRSTEAGLKYFVLGALASGMLLYGASLLYGFAGSTNFQAIAAVFAGDPGLGLLFGMVFVLAGLAFKISAVPFHMWTPDVYEGAPTPVTAFFASAPKVAGMALLIRVCVNAMLPAAEQWQQIITFIAIASMVLGAVGAIGQTNIKRLVAYSSIANVGFMLIGLAAAAVNPVGIVAVLIYLLVYIVMTLGTMLAILQLRRADGSYSENIADLSGLYRSRPGLAAALAAFMFSLAGIPPLFGFWPKLLVFNAAINAQMFPLAVIGVLASVIGAFYYLRIIKVMFFDEPGEVVFPVVGQGRIARVVMFLAAVFILALGLGRAVPLPVIGVLAIVIGALYYLKIKLISSDEPSDVVFPVDRQSVLERAVMLIAALFISVAGWGLIVPLQMAAEAAVRSMI